MRRDYNTAKMQSKQLSGVPLPRTGVFTDRFLVIAGEFAGRMEKRLHGVVSGEIADAHIRAMEEYAAALRSMGVKVADTIFRKIPARRGFVVTLFQEKFDDDELVTTIVRKAEREKCLDVFERTLREGVKAIDYKRWHDGRDKMGFHSSLRNWAVRGGEFFFLDLTPPLRRVDGRTHPLTFLRHIPARFRFIPSLRLRDVFFRIASRDSFEMPVMLAGCLASAVSRRREFEREFRAKTLEIIEKCIPAGERAAYLEKIAGTRLGIHRRINRFVRTFFRS